MLLLPLLVAVASAEDPADVQCPDHADRAVVQAAVAVEQRWLDLDPGFELERHKLERFIDCVREPLSTADAVILHRARAIAAFVDGDTEAATRAFLALHTLDPSWAPPAAIPDGHPLRALWDAAVARSESARILRFRAAPPTGWAIDGTRFPRPGDGPDQLDAYGLPADRAFVLQLFDEHAVVAYTGYHDSVADVPVRQLAVVDEDASRQRRKTGRIAGGTIGAALLAGGAAAFAVGWHDRQLVADGQLPLVDVQPTAARGNALGATAYVLAGAGLLSVTLGLAVPW